MKTSPIDKTLFAGTAWMLLLLVPITFIGFYPSYFSKFHSTTSTVIHLHSLLMLLWLATVVAQPLFLKFNKFHQHRLVGKISYGIMPLVIFSGYLILRYSYQRVINGDDVGPPGFYPPDLPLDIKAAEFVVIGTVYWVWLVLYYILGVHFRKTVVAHATFMLAAALTILGPADDRLIGHVCDALDWPFNAVAGNHIFALVGLVFISLFFFHQKKKLSLQPTLTVLLIHGIGIFLFYTLPFHPAWNQLAVLLFNT